MKLENTWLGKRIVTLENGRQVLKMGASVNFVFVTYDKQLILAKQFRAGDNKTSVNCFGGWVDEGENEYQTMVREAYEEANIKVTDILKTHVLHDKLCVSMGYTDEVNTLYIVQLSKELKELDLKCNDEDENITFEIIDMASEEGVVKIKELMKETKALKLYYALKELV